MCGDIHPHPGPTTTSANSSASSINHDAIGQRPRKSNLFCMYMNARSLKKNIYAPGNLPISNLLKFQEVDYSDMLDLIFISETWLNSEILNKEILPYGFDIYFADRAL